jgi:hypothetical protein
MLDCEGQAQRIDSRFLGLACDSGNFLVQVSFDFLGLTDAAQERSTSSCAAMWSSSSWATVVAHEHYKIQIVETLSVELQPSLPSIERRARTCR